MTFVLTLIAILLSPPSFAKGPTKSNYQPETKAQSALPPTQESEDHSLDRLNLIPTAPSGEPTEPRTSSSFYPYRQGLALRFLGLSTTDHDHPTETGVGVSYLWPRIDTPQLEMGADVVREYGGHLNFGVRHIYRRRTYFRPYSTWGLTHHVEAKDGLGTLINHENYFFRLAVGFEQTMRLPSSLKIDLEVLAGVKRQMALLALGWSWGW